MSARDVAMAMATSMITVAIAAMANLVYGIVEMLIPLPKKPIRFAFVVSSVTLCHVEFVLEYSFLVKIFNQIL
jgi:hypothetical protein